MDYIVIKSPNMLSLIREVNKALADGYSLAGGIATAYNGYMGSVEYLQAMIK